MRRAVPAPRLASAVLAFASLAFVGCAGGGPLLHPAHALPKGEVRVAAGLSADAIGGGAASSLTAARNEVASDTSGALLNDPAFVKGALVAAAIGPGIAPFASARVGLGYDFEGGLAYTGRAARGDVRHAFTFGEDHAWAVSIGVGGSAVLYGREQGTTLPGVDLSDLKGYGADVPLLIGYRSAAGLYMIWFGVRGGWEHDQIAEVTSEPKAVTLGIPPVGLTADRYWGGGVLGVAMGFRHVHVALELDAQVEYVTGQFGGTSASVTGASIVPATALWLEF
jgi:hypothetical protein